MHRRTTSLPTQFALVTLMLASAAFAQATPPPPPADAPPVRGGACSADAASLCPNLGRRATAQCLASQSDKVSATCKAHMDAMKARMEAAKEACQPDVEKFCAGVATGGGRIMQCLKQHQSELSDACKAAEPKHHGPPPVAAPPAQPPQ